MKITFEPEMKRLTDCVYTIVCDPTTVDFNIMVNRSRSRVMSIRKVPEWVTADLLLTTLDQLIAKVGHIPLSYFYYAHYIKPLPKGKYLHFFFSRTRQFWVLNEVGEGDVEETLNFDPKHEHYIQQYLPING